MELDDFQELLDARGADLAAWPADDRRQAEELLERSAGARAALDDAVRLEALLTRSLAAERASDALRARISAVPAGRLRPLPAEKGWWPGVFTRPWRIGTAAVTAALLFGIYAGASGVPLFEDPRSPAPAADEIIDVADLAFGPEIEEDVLP